MKLDHHPSPLGELSLASLFPDLRDLVFYLGDFLQVSATVVVGDLGFEFVDLLLVLPGKLREAEGRERQRFGLVIDVNGGTGFPIWHSPEHRRPPIWTGTNRIEKM